MILASTSPRRIELLARAGIRARIERPDADETRRPGESPRRMVARLAKDKALSVLNRLKTGRDGDVVIGADTTVLSPSGRLLGKPRNRAEAKKMLRELAGRPHTVLTGYCLCYKEGRLRGVIQRVVSSTVQIRALSENLIDQYVASGEPMDKAGAYAAQGIGMMLIEGIRGSYTNVVGLPMSQLITDLESHFDIRPRLATKGARR